ncbi:MAG: UPF0179 family protein [Thermoplasmata archaeon]|nr:UPF0179 family protein [Thermoplasmata archaeon]
MLTVVGTSLAKKGQEIIFLGPLSECKVCKVKNICFHLEKGSHYKVIGVRDVMHDCNVHEEGVKVVEIEKLPFKAIMDKKKAIDGSTIAFESPSCIERGCEHYLLCNPPGLGSKQKVKILSVGGKAECAAGMSRVLVTLE